MEGMIVGGTGYFRRRRRRRRRRREEEEEEGAFEGRREGEIGTVDEGM